MRSRIFNVLVCAAVAAVTLFVVDGLVLSASAGLEMVRGICPLYPCWLLGEATDVIGLFGVVVGLMVILSVVHRRQR